MDMDFAKLKSAVKSHSLVQPEQREPVLDPRRCSIFTASKIFLLMTNGRKSSEMGKTAISYIEEKACEFLTGISTPSFCTAATQWGTDTELPAIFEAEKVLGLLFEKTGKNQEFIISPCGIYGGTPDGIIPGVVGIEAHCPNTVNHLRYRGCDIAEKLKHANPQKYWQIQCLLTLTEFSCWYFCSFDPRLPRADFRLHLLRIEPNTEDIAAMKERIYAATEIKNRIIETGIIG